jgi:ArsR family transcriptional regulator, cadmium/lead-responsive transcriptional repressor
MSGGTLPGEPDEGLWAAVAEPSRRRLLDLLLEQGPRTPTELAEQVPFSRQAVAKHLAVLGRVGLVQGRRSGREVRYTVRSRRLDDAVRELESVAAQWDTRLRAIKRLAEAAHREARRPNALPDHREMGDHANVHDHPEARDHDGAGQDLRA